MAARPGQSPGERTGEHSRRLRPSIAGAAGSAGSAEERNGPGEGPVAGSRPPAERRSAQPAGHGCGDQTDPAGRQADRRLEFQRAAHAGRRQFHQSQSRPAWPEGRRRAALGGATRFHPQHLQGAPGRRGAGRCAEGLELRSQCHQRALPYRRQWLLAGFASLYQPAPLQRDPGCQHAQGAVRRG
ncbi:hypothetical protein D9M70_530650 [compost metagenome]